MVQADREGNTVATTYVQETTRLWRTGSKRKRNLRSVVALLLVTGGVGSNGHGISETSKDTPRLRSLSIRAIFKGIREWKVSLLDI